MCWFLPISFYYSPLYTFFFLYSSSIPRMPTSLNERFENLKWCYLSKLNQHLSPSIFPFLHPVWTDKVVVDDGRYKTSSPVCISFSSIRMRIHEHSIPKWDWKYSLHSWVFGFVLFFFYIPECFWESERERERKKKKEICEHRSSELWQKFTVDSCVIRLSIIILNYGICVLGTLYHTESSSRICTLANRFQLLYAR